MNGWSLQVKRCIGSYYQRNVISAKELEDRKPNPAVVPSAFQQVNWFRKCMSMVHRLLSEHYACCSGMLQALGGLSAWQRGTEDKHHTYCVVTCSSAVWACMQHLSSHDLHLPQHQSDVVHKCPQLAWYMHGQPRKQLVMGKPVKMLSNYNQKQNRTEPEVHVIDEHYGGRCWILATQSTEKLVLCSVPTTKMGHVKLTWQQLSI